MRESVEDKRARARKIKHYRLKAVVAGLPVFTNDASKLDAGQPIDNQKKRCGAVKATAYEMHPDTAKAIGAAVSGDITEQRAEEATGTPGTKAHKEAAERADEAKNPGRKAAKEARQKAKADAAKKVGPQKGDADE